MLPRVEEDERRRSASSSSENKQRTVTGPHSGLCTRFVKYLLTGLDAFKPARGSSLPMLISSGPAFSALYDCLIFFGTSPFDLTCTSFPSLSELVSSLYLSCRILKAFSENHFNMSYLQNQISAFKSSVNSSSSKLANKRSVAATGNNAPTSSQTSTGSNDLKRKRPEQKEQIFSQPADTGTGRNMMTQIIYAIEYLKTKGTPQTLTDLLSYLSLQHREKSYKQTIRSILTTHPKVEYGKKPNGEDTFSFRPAHNIRSGNDLLRHLQSQPTAQGLSFKDLRDGWPDAEATVDDLENQGKLLVLRNKKDNHARMVWPNDPSLEMEIDGEFQDIWNKIKLPQPEVLADELKREGLTPANKRGTKKLPPKTPEKKTKKPRKGGRTTNTHMAGVLRDYSHLRK